MWAEHLPHRTTVRVYAKQVLKKWRLFDCCSYFIINSTLPSNQRKQVSLMPILQKRKWGIKGPELGLLGLQALVPTLASGGPLSLD